MLSRFMLVRVKIERESRLFISAYEPGSEKCDEIEDHWYELNE